MGKEEGRKWGEMAEFRSQGGGAARLRSKKTNKERICGGGGSSDTLFIKQKGSVNL
jgi:hypothetical protein